MQQESIIDDCKRAGAKPNLICNGSFMAAERNTKADQRGVFTC
jgi:hypothetical protein